jgi:5,5'-dehydrodivanillate O-demethylase
MARAKRFGGGGRVCPNMLSKEENALFTTIGPGTPMGEMLRRYWHPVGASEFLTVKPQRVKVLGEELLLYRG